MTAEFKLILLKEKTNLGKVVVETVSNNISIVLNPDKKQDYEPLFEIIVAKLTRKEGLHCAYEGLTIKNPPELFLTALSQTLLLNFGILLQKEN